jgi:hypothetical protein
MSLDLAELEKTITTDDPPKTSPHESPMLSWPVPLTDAALHGATGDLVKRLAPHTEADSAAILFHWHPIEL